MPACFLIHFILVLRFMKDQTEAHACCWKKEIPILLVLQPRFTLAFA